MLKFIGLVITVASVQASGSWRYLTMIDAGSSGCRAHVFRWRPTGTSIEVNPKHESFKVKPGLSTFASNPTEAGASLDGLLSFVEEKIPASHHAESPLWLKATAGLRMIEHDAAEAILESVRDTLELSPFRFDREWARVIPGSDEGGFGWLSVNYLLGNLNSFLASPPNFKTVVEMGGASAQVTQLVSIGGKSAPENYGFTYRSSGGDVYQLYTYSYLGWGLEKAREALSSSIRDDIQDTAFDPCLNKGFIADNAEHSSVYDGPSNVQVVGVSTYEKCAGAVEDLFKAANQAAVAANGGCPHPSCSFGGTYQPVGLAAIWAFENFYYTAKMLDLSTPDSSPLSMRSAAKQVCDLPWEKLTALYPKDNSDKEENNKLCFGATYLDKFLTTGLGVQNSEHITIQQEIDGQGIDWSLGAAIHEASDFYGTQRGVLGSFMAFIASYGMVALGGPCMAILCCYFMNMQKKRSVLHFDSRKK